MKKIAIAALLSALVAAPAIAADAYVGVDFGTNKMDFTGVSSSTAYGILGGYSFNENIAAELSYNSLGDATVDSTSDKVSANVMALAAVASLPLSKDFSLMAKLGYASSTMTFQGQSESKADLTYGIGAQYNVSKTIGIRVNYDSFKAGDASKFTSATKDSTMTTIGAVFKM